MLLASILGVYLLISSDLMGVLAPRVPEALLPQFPVLLFLQAPLLNSFKSPNLIRCWPSFKPATACPPQPKSHVLTLPFRASPKA